MTALRFTTTRAIGAAIAMTISAGALAAQTPTTPRDTTMRDSTMRGTMGTMQDTTRRGYTGTRSTTTGATRVRKDTYGGSSAGSSMQVRKETSGGEVTPAPAPMQQPAPMPAPAPAPMPAPAVDSSSMMRDSSSMSTSTTTTTTSTTTTTTEEVPPMMGRPTRFGNGFYVGVQGGANFPQNEINTFYKTGYGAGAQLGWDPVSSPIGLRVNAMWNRLQGQDLARQSIGNTTFTGRYQDSDLYSAFADAKLRLPFGRFLGATSGLYAVGGGGIAYFRNYQTFQNVTGTGAGQSVTGRFNAEDVTKFALNGGGGLSFGVGAVSLFVESRYVRVFTQGRNTDYVPVTLGITFH